MNNKKPFFSVYIPAYNQSQTIIETLDSIKNQTFTDFEIILRDDGSKDNTYQIAQKYKDSRLKVFKNKVNLGYSGNLNQGIKDCIGEYIFFLAGDDLIDKNTLKLYYDAIKKHPKAGAITRTYYWFDKDYHQPVRLKPTLSSKSKQFFSINDSPQKIFLLLNTIDQLSGLCFKRSLMKVNFNQEPWISHGYPWLSIFKNYPAIFIKEYTLAVRIGLSATRTNIYKKSPMVCWKEMVESVLFEKKYSKIKNAIIRDFIGINYIGLVQIRNYGSFRSYIREVSYLIKFRRMNLLNPKFWIIFLITLITPRPILRLLTDKFKTVFNSRFISKDIVINLS